VALTVDAGVIRVVIEDDGVGFDVARAEQPGRWRGLGLLGMRARRN
jgi:signal transduction histidine kinase